MNASGRRLVGLTVGCALTATALTGCATGGGAAGQLSTTPRSDLAAPAEVAARNAEQQPSVVKGEPGRAGREDTPRPRKVRKQDKGAQNATPTSTDGQAAGASWTVVQASVDDRSDHGNGPAYADLTSVALEDDGTNLKVTVELGDTVPGVLASEEVQGVGVDVYRSSGRESDYQVFLDGGSSGWRGHLQTPKGFVRFPGSVRVTGTTLVAVLPWSAVGGRSDARVWTFADWSDGRGHSSADSLDLGPVRVD